MSKCPNLTRIARTNKAIRDAMEKDSQNKPTPALGIPKYLGLLVAEYMDLNETMAFIADLMLEKEKHRGEKE